MFCLNVHFIEYLQAPRGDYELVFDYADPQYCPDCYDCHSEDCPPGLAWFFDGPLNQMGNTGPWWWGKAKKFCLGAGQK